MRVARWRWVLVPLVVLIAGCLPQPTLELPTSFADRLRERGWAFEVAPVPTAEVATAANVVSELTGLMGYGPMVRTRAVPVFGILRCTGAVEQCQPGPLANPGSNPRRVWLVVYPERAGADGDAGWVLVDAVARTGGSAYVHDPLDPDLER